MATQEVLLNRDIFRLILGYALSIHHKDLIKNYELIYHCTLTCKKWRTIVFELFIPHFRKYNYENEQFIFDNIIYTSRLIKRKYFESDNHSHYKQPNIEHDNRYILVKPEYYINFLKNSENLRYKQQTTNAKFARVSPTKICKICSTISQTRTVCGVYLHKLHLKKLQREKEERDRELKEKTTTEESHVEPDENNTDEEEIPDVEGVIPVDRPDIDIDDADADDADDADADADDADDDDADDADDE